MKISKLLVMVMLVSMTTLSAQEEIPLYPRGVQLSNGLTVPEKMETPDFIVDISAPRMYKYEAPKEIATGTSVLICPGGGYIGISQKWEGSMIAQWMNQQGITAFVLYYRMPNGHADIPLKDAQTALSIIHRNARVWSLNAGRIGVCGFSAGGHLAATLGTLWKNNLQRPAFMILAYPVISMDSTITHSGSRANLLGMHPSSAQVKLYSCELQVTNNTPPTFIVHAKNDKVVPIENSERMARALEAHHVSVKLVEYDEGNHAFAMHTRGLPVDHWPKVLKSWLKEQGLVSK